MFAVAVLYPSDHHSADLYLYNVAEVYSVEDSVFTAVALIYVIVPECDRVDGVKDSADEEVARFISVVNVAVAVVVIHFKAEYKADSAFVPSCEKAVSEEVRNAVVGVLYPEKTASVYPVCGKLRVAWTDKVVRLGINGTAEAACWALAGIFISWGVVRNLIGM